MTEETKKDTIPAPPPGNDMDLDAAIRDFHSIDEIVTRRFSEMFIVEHWKEIVSLAGGQIMGDPKLIFSKRIEAEGETFRSVLSIDCSTARAPKVVHVFLLDSSWDISEMLPLMNLIGTSNVLIFVSCVSEKGARYLEPSLRLYESLGAHVVRLDNQRVKEWMTQYVEIPQADS